MNNENPEGIPQFSRPFGNKLVELIEIKRGASILDIGMGNGTATFFPAVKKVGNHGRVIGIDISDEMVRETYRRLKASFSRTVRLIMCSVDFPTFIPQWKKYFAC